MCRELKAKKDAVGDDETSEETDDSKRNYDYLLSMSILSLTLERVKQLQSDRDTKSDELQTLQAKTPCDCECVQDFTLHFLSFVCVFPYVYLFLLAGTCAQEKGGLDLLFDDWQCLNAVWEEDLLDFMERYEAFEAEEEAREKENAKVSVVSFRSLLASLSKCAYFLLLYFLCVSQLLPSVST